MMHHEPLLRRPMTVNLSDQPQIPSQHVSQSDQPQMVVLLNHRLPIYVHHKTDLLHQ